MKDPQSYKEPTLGFTLVNPKNQKKCVLVGSHTGGFRLYRDEELSMSGNSSVLTVIEQYKDKGYFVTKMFDPKE